MPADAWYFSTVSLRPSASQARNLAILIEAFTSQPGFGPAWEALQSSSGSNGILALERDLLPLLDGEVAIGMSGAVPEDPRALMLLHSSSPSQLLNTLFPNAFPLVRLAGNREGGESATLFLLERDRGIATAYAGWVIVAESRDSIEEAIARIDRGPSAGLATSSRFLEVRDRLPAETFSYSYADTSRILEAIMAGSPAATDPAQAESNERMREMLNARHGVALSARSDGLAVHFERLGEEPIAVPSYPSGNAISVFERLPADTLAATSGSSFTEVLVALDESIEMARRSAPASFPIGDFDFSQWLAREYVLGLSRGTLDAPDGQVEGALVARVGAPGAVEADLDRLDALFPPKAVQTVIVDGQRFKQVELSPGQTATYGVVDDWLYLTNGDVARVLAAAQTGGLRGNPRFRMVEADLTANGSNIFVDLEAVRVLSEEMAAVGDLRTYRLTVQPFLTPLRALGGGWTLHENGDASGLVVLAIRR